MIVALIVANSKFGNSRDIVPECDVLTCRDHKTTGAKGQYLAIVVCVATLVATPVLVFATHSTQSSRRKPLSQQPQPAPQHQQMPVVSPGYGQQPQYAPQHYGQQPQYAPQHYGQQPHAQYAPQQYPAQQYVAQPQYGAVPKH